MFANYDKTCSSFFTSRKYSVTDDILLFLYNLCSSGISWQMAESPELFDTAFTLQERLDIPDGFVQREMVYISILLGTLVLCLFFFFMQRRMKKLRERDRERYLQLLEGILDNLPIAAKVKDVNDGMRYTFWNKKAEELFECSAREAIGKTDFETMPEAAALIRKEDEELVKTGIPQEGIRRFLPRRTRSGLPSRTIIL